jgi:hypothetical protein
VRSPFLERLFGDNGCSVVERMGERRARMSKL